MPPVDVPPITSKSSCTRLPVACSSDLSISIVSSARVPPPSSARTRTPRTPGESGRGPGRPIPRRPGARGYVPSAQSSRTDAACHALESSMARTLRCRIKRRFCASARCSPGRRSTVALARSSASTFSASSTLRARSSASSDMIADVFAAWSTL
eukprot:422986-Prymnesium_polylepis.1